MDAIGGEAKTLRRSIAYPVLFTDSAGILQIARPGQAQRSAFKVTIREHVGQAERVVIFLCQSGQWDGIDGSITVRDARKEQKDEKKNQRNCRKVAGWRKLTGKQLEVFLDAVVARETVVGLVEGQNLWKETRHGNGQIRLRPEDGAQRGCDEVETQDICSFNQRQGIELIGFGQQSRLFVGRISGLIKS